jgi:hypothetical protein
VEEQKIILASRAKHIFSDKHHEGDFLNTKIEWANVRCATMVLGIAQQIRCLGIIASRRVVS